MTVTILSPLVGTLVPLSAVPDPMFAQGMMGPGVAVEPPVEVVDVIAPLAGTLLQVFPHAFVVVSDDGLGILVHLGIDTVKLEGAGFTALAAKGDRVEAGTPVITYDVAAVRATGLATVVPVVVLERSPDDVRVDASEGEHLLPGAPLLSL